MTYVKLFGGPWDGRVENVHEACDVLRLAPPMKLQVSAVAAPLGKVERFFPCSYRRSPEDPSRFVYEGTEE